jgi:hypothetical protein
MALRHVGSAKNKADHCTKLIATAAFLLHTALLMGIRFITTHHASVIARCNKAKQCILIGNVIAMLVASFFFRFLPSCRIPSTTKFLLLLTVTTIPLFSIGRVHLLVVYFSLPSVFDLTITLPPMFDTTILHSLPHVEVCPYPRWRLCHCHSLW